jgi:ornithine carbamoyltransferase
MKKTVEMRGRSLLKLQDLSEPELLYLLDLAVELKKKKKAGKRGELLDRKNIAMVFEKMSTRTRCAVAVAAADEGGRTEYLSSHEIHLGKKESTEDTARVLGRMFDGILFRGYRQQTVELLARYSGVPVWNGLTDEFHPTQTLADLMTIREYFGRLKGLKVVYVGDGRNNVATSLMDGCAKSGIHYVACSPPELSPLPGKIQRARETAEKNGATVGAVHIPRTAVQGANVIYTDVWASMGEESKLQERIRLLKPYQVNMEMLQWTGNIEKGKVIFLHCLPAFHDHHTDLTRNIGALEVTDEVFEAPFSRVFDGAENRVHTMKALIVATLAEGGRLRQPATASHGRRKAESGKRKAESGRRKTGGRKKK